MLVALAVAVVLVAALQPSAVAARIAPLNAVHHLVVEARYAVGA